MRPGQIRPIVICVFRDGDRTFVAEYHDPSSGVRFYRPLGGAIGFGEHSRECIVREMREETGAEIKDLTYVGMIENIFTFDGSPGHEIVLVYEASFVDPRLYEVESFRCQDDDGEFVASWKSIDEFRAEKARLYPEGLLDLLDKAREHPDSG
jgi:8-oxo-dGTP pyrophosphatase MutT (NUDIX family)